MGPTTYAQLARLAQAYPKQETPVATLEVYAEDLAEIPAPVLEAAVTRLIRTVEWFPTIRAIREAAAENLLALPSETEALQEVDLMTRWAREQDGEPPRIHPLIDRAAKMAGGYREFRVSDEPAVVRGQFTRYYRELRAAAIRDAQLDAALGVRSPREVAA